MKILKVSMIVSLVSMLSQFAVAGTCVDLGGIGRYFSVNAFYNIRYDRYARLIDQAENSKGHLFKHAVKKIQNACPSKSEAEIRDLLIIGDSDGTFCPDRTQSEGIPFFNSADVMSVRKVIQTVQKNCQETADLE